MLLEYLALSRPCLLGEALPLGESVSLGETEKPIFIRRRHPYFMDNYFISKNKITCCFPIYQQKYQQYFLPPKNKVHPANAYPTAE